MKKEKTIWIFTGSQSRHPSGVFTSFKKAEEWIKANNLEGVLSEFPLDEGTYDHALRNNLFTPRHDGQRKPSFIGDFSPRLSHFHYGGDNAE